MRNRIFTLFAVFALSTWAALSWGGSSSQDTNFVTAEAVAEFPVKPASNVETSVVRGTMSRASSKSLFVQTDCIPVQGYKATMKNLAGDDLPLRQDDSGIIDIPFPEDLVQFQIVGSGWEPQDLTADELGKREEIVVKALRKVSVAVYSKRSELPIHDFRLTFVAGSLDSEGAFHPGWMKKSFVVKDSNSVTLGGYSKRKGIQSHFQIWIEAEGYPKHYSEAVPISNQEDWVSLELRLDELSESSFIVQGVVLSMAGLPMEGAMCSLVPEPISWDYISSENGMVDLTGFIDPRKSDLDQGKTDTNGEFQMTSQRSGEYSLLVEFPGRPFFRMDLGELGPGRVPDYLTVTLAESSYLLVRLTYPEDVNPDSYSVKLSHDIQFAATATDPSLGVREFLFAGVSPGTAELTLTHHALEGPNQASFLVLEKRNIQIQQLGENLEIFNLDPALQNDGVAVKVPEIDGMEYQDWTVLVAEAGHGGQERQALVDADGFANFENIPQGEWEVTGMAFDGQKGIFIMGFATFNIQDLSLDGVVPLVVSPSTVHIRFPNATEGSKHSDLKLFTHTADSPHQRFLEGLSQSSLACRSPFTLMGLPDGSYSISINGLEGRQWSLDQDQGHVVHLEFP